MSSARLDDYIDDITMDIDQKFYPLPLINLPNVVISTPQIPNYNFQSEHKAIAEYENDKAIRNIVIAATAAVAAVANATTTAKDSEEEEPVCSKSAARIELRGTEDMITIRKVRSVGILEPSRVPLGTNNNTLRKSTSIKPCMVNCFEEFEAKPSLFDLLEMNTIDDKAALEEVLLATSIPNISNERRDHANNIKL